MFEGVMHVAGTTFDTRDTFVRKNSRTIAHMTEASVYGQWVKLNEETCSLVTKFTFGW